MPASHAVWASAALLALTAACVDPADTTISVGKKGEGCMGTGCGSNNAIVDGTVFYELILGQPNNTGPDGVTFVGMADTYLNAVAVPPVLHESHVWTNRLVGLAPFIEHLTLKNKYLVLKIHGQTSLLWIKDVHRDNLYWTSNELPEFESYTIEFAAPPDIHPSFAIWRPFCDVTTADTDWADYAMDVVIFEGDRFDPNTRKVTNSSPDDSTGPTWFNIACQGSLVAKQHHARRTRASQDFAFPVPTITLNQRQAFANMWSANYCGDGHPWTEPHEPLLFQDAEGAFLHEAPISWEDDEEPVYEAVWNESGAVCLDTPRRLAEEPTIMTSIRRHCQAQNHPIPTCRSQAWFPKEWREHGTLLTAVP